MGETRRPNARRCRNTTKARASSCQAKEVVQALTAHMVSATQAAAAASTAAADAAEAVADSDSPTEAQIDEAEKDSKAAERTYHEANKVKKELQGAVAASTETGHVEEDEDEEEEALEAILLQEHEPSWHY